LDENQSPANFMQEEHLYPDFKIEFWKNVHFIPKYPTILLAI
jgi:hypothetical protein